jgi:hypothetical protein
MIKYKSQFNKQKIKNNNKINIAYINSSKHSSFQKEARSYRQQSKQTNFNFEKQKYLLHERATKRALFHLDHVVFDHFPSCCTNPTQNKQQKPSRKRQTKVAVLQK